jgi:hypothetical protein
MKKSPIHLLLTRAEKFAVSFTEKPTPRHEVACNCLLLFRKDWGKLSLYKAASKEGLLAYKLHFNQ